MGSQALGTMQIFDLYSRHANLRELAAAHERDVLPAWKQIYEAYGLAASTADELWEFVREDLYRWWEGSASAETLPIPPRGITVEDSAYGTVLVHPDASGILRFTATDNAELAAAVNQPMYAQDPEYWELLEQIARRYGEALELAIDWTPIVVAGVVLIGANALVGGRR